MKRKPEFTIRDIKAYNLILYVSDSRLSALRRLNVCCQEMLADNEVARFELHNHTQCPYIFYELKWSVNFSPGHDHFCNVTDKIYDEHEPKEDKPQGAELTIQNIKHNVCKSYLCTFLVNSSSFNLNRQKNLWTL